MKGPRCSCCMEPAEKEKGHPELCGGRSGSEPFSATCLHSHQAERIKDSEKAVPDDASTPAKGDAQAMEGTVAPEAKLPNKCVLKKFAVSKNVTIEDGASHALKEAGC